MVEFVSVLLVVVITTMLLMVRVLYVISQSNKRIPNTSQKQLSTLIVLGSAKLWHKMVPTSLQGPKATEFLQTYRSREAGQSYITSVGTTLFALGHALWLMIKIRPRVILCNGPGTCVPICAIAFIFKVFGIRWSYFLHGEYRKSQKIIVEWLASLQITYGGSVVCAVATTTKTISPSVL
ncbi:hypothetical protein CTI12_AA610280 [Artemisia annua]|uniref:UDP-N-acetylglucosamine transferase subunit ALG14 n=1 Tax=Artemisia annua TaxID=35608 RepID=A0A2U1KFH7_ARTAN|nr:hypothetical protein CTI12_AA610280 [Artemisia annua]